MNFVFEGTSARLIASHEHAGRVKAPPSSMSPDQIQFTVYDAAGVAVYAGAVDHPIRRHYEVEDENRPGRLRPVAAASDDGAFQIRLPADLDAARIVLTDVSFTPVRTPKSRRVLADLPLR